MINSINEPSAVLGTGDAKKTFVLKSFIVFKSSHKHKKEEEKKGGTEEQSTVTSWHRPKGSWEFRGAGKHRGLRISNSGITGVVEFKRRG